MNRLPLVALLTSLALHGAGAQDSASTGAAVLDTVAVPRCDGAIVTAIEVQTRRPDFSSRSAQWWRRAARTVGLHHHTTDAAIVRRFVSLDVGHACTEFRRAESERILRAQPYLSTASVRTVSDGHGGVRVLVETEDEIPAIVSARLRRGTLAATRLGNTNLFGRALHAELRAEQGFAYRDGFGGKLSYNQLFGRPYTIAVEGERRPVGHYQILEAGHAFLTDLQRVAWHVGFATANDYLGLTRGHREEDEPQHVLSVHRRGWDVGGVLRFGPPGKLGLIGAAITGERVDPSTGAVVLTDSGITPVPADAPVLPYGRIRAVRPNAIVGVRAVSYRTVEGFDGLASEEDLASGLQFNLIAGPGLRLLGGEDEDFMLATQLYVGSARERSYVALHAEGEARRTSFDSTRWDGVLGSGRAAWYLKQSRRLTLVADLLGTAAWRPRLPVALTLGDHHGAGVRGFGESHDVGERRLVARVEQRWYAGPFRQRADLGAAVFADAGRLWAGDSPYAAGTPVSGAVGLSLLASVPRRSQRLWRLDFAVPVRGRADARWEVRVSSARAGHHFWEEPAELTRARSMAGPARVFSWP